MLAEEDNNNSLNLFKSATRADNRRVWREGVFTGDQLKTKAGEKMGIHHSNIIVIYWRERGGFFRFFSEEKMS